MKNKKLLFATIITLMYMFSLASPAFAYTASGGTTPRSWYSSQLGTLSFSATTSATYDYFLGVKYLMGVDIELDNVKAHKWYITGTKYFYGDWIKVQVKITDRSTGIKVQDTTSTVWDGWTRWNSVNYGSYHFTSSESSGLGFKIDILVTLKARMHGNVYKTYTWGLPSFNA